MGAPVRMTRTNVLLVIFAAILIISTYFFHDNAFASYNRAASGLTSMSQDSEANYKDEVRRQNEQLQSIAEQVNRVQTELDNLRKKEGDARTKTSIERNIDYLHSIAHEKFWREAPSSVWQAKKQDWMEYVNNSIPSYSGESHRFSGRGILTVGGNGDTLDRVKVTLSMLREYKSKLPVEVHYLDGELSDADVAELKKMGATARNLGDSSNLFPVSKRAGKGGKSFHIKTAAMINSAFEEILYLDSDSMPVRDPSYLFNSREYQRTGTMFFPDFWKTHFTNPIWQIFDSPIVDEWENESGQVLLNKRTNWEALLLANYLNIDGDFYFQLLNGDKDTLRFAHKGLRKEYYMVPTFLTCGGLIYADRFCGNTMVQHDHLDAVAFVHANLLKEFSRSELNTDAPEGVFRIYKEYTAAKDNTWLKPRFYTSSVGVPCMELDAKAGEPDIREAPFEALVPGWNAFYKKHGGLGGGYL